jgi:hypothetical protein
MRESRGIPRGPRADAASFARGSAEHGRGVALRGSFPSPGLGNLFLDPTDGLFSATLGQPNIGTVITGMTNAGPGLIQVNLPPFPPTSAVLYAQCISLNFGSNTLTGLSNLGASSLEI